MKYFGDAVILCGGKSKRMDFDKSLAKINDKYIIEVISEKLALCFENVRLCADTREKLDVFALKVIEDSIKGRVGPSAGIYSALKNAATKYVFVAACDMPFISPPHIEYMKYLLKQQAFKADALVPRHGEFIEPLYAFYSGALASLFAKEIEAGNFKIHDILHKCNTQYLEEKYSRIFDENLAMFTNINYKADLERISC
ncbi:MAG: molybdenum cofactor guanylyltransferase [Firmicutes bacterium]|nr:molybdenum cofactor guanylyltransferase [Bacillota bacterium]